MREPVNFFCVGDVWTAEKIRMNGAELILKINNELSNFSQFCAAVRCSFEGFPRIEIKINKLIDFNCFMFSPLFNCGFISSRLVNSVLNCYSQL